MAHDEITRQKAMVDALVEQRTRELQEALETKTLLLHEVDHRVKNNLTMIGSLLRLQARSIPDTGLRSTLENMLERVDALAAVHRQLYQSSDLRKFDIGQFIEQMVTDIVGAAGRDDIKLKFDLARLEIASSKASAVGLIVNEIVTNAIKHAFADGRSGILTITVQEENGRARIKIADDGPGFDANTVRSGSLGRTLIDRLGRQIGDTPLWHSDATGTWFSMIA